MRHCASVEIRVKPLVGNSGCRCMHYYAPQASSLAKPYLGYFCRLFCLFFGVTTDVILSIAVRYSKICLISQESRKTRSTTECIFRATKGVFVPYKIKEGYKK